jgi:murein DD-endopeptidase MepM/ murein hydrolase activator NlpD
MVIPHGESNIVSIQLSKFTIYFGVFIAIAIIFASIISTQLQVTIRPEVNQLNSTNQTYYYEREQYVEKFKKIQIYQKRMKSRLVSLFEMANMLEEESDIFLGESEIKKLAEFDMGKESNDFMLKMIGHMEKKKSDKHLLPDNSNPDIQLLNEFTQVYSQQKNFKYSSEVVLYRELVLDIKQTENILAVFESFLSQRENVQKSLPYYWPIGGGHFTSFFGPRFSPFGYTSEFHLGVDLADRTGTPVYAAADGRVVLSSFSNGYGRNVILQHKYGYSTVYAHLNSMFVTPGQLVKKGDKIGAVGQTGRATGPHLHFEVRIEGKHINPLPYLTTL